MNLFMTEMKKKMKKNNNSRFFHTENEFQGSHLLPTSSPIITHDTHYFLPLHNTKKICKL